MLNLDTPAKRALARSRLDEVISRGRAQAQRTVRTIWASVPRDEISPTRDMAYAHDAQLTTRLGTADLTGHADGQLLDRLSKGLRTYVTALRDDSSAADRVQIADVVAYHLGQSQERFLVRHVGNQVRGVLSDSYRRMATPALASTFLAAVDTAGALAVSGSVTETRVALRAILPTVIEPIPGEAMVLGVHWQTSDFGAGAYTLTAFGLRLVCLNGMTGETALKKVHLGRTIQDETGLLSAEAHDAGQRALELATRDLVGGLLGPSAVERRVEAIRAAATQTVDAAGVLRRLPKALALEVKTAYEGPDTLNLPEGASKWRLSNALSFVANSEAVRANPDQRLELQAMAGDLVTGF